VAQGKGPEFKPQYCQKKKIIVSRIWSIEHFIIIFSHMASKVFLS
jgi:hypothetical protein